GIGRRRGRQSRRRGRRFRIGRRKLEFRDAGFVARISGDAVAGGAGESRDSWTVDYPRGERTFATAIRRLPRIDVRSVKQPTSPDDGDDIFYWPYLHAGMPTAWSFSEAQAAKIREHLLRGGFLVCDSFFGTQEWEGFLRGIRQIFPDREIEDVPDNDPIFHTA